MGKKENKIDIYGNPINGIFDSSIITQARQVGKEESTGEAPPKKLPWYKKILKLSN